MLNQSPWKTGSALLLALMILYSLCVPAAAARKPKAVSSYSHYFVIQSDGSLWGWGHNADGEVGNQKGGHNAVVNKPVKVMENVVDAAGGRSYSMALQADGSLWTWGDNLFGQLGDGTRTNRQKPQKIMDGVQSISSSTCMSAAVKADGSLWTWGSSLGSGLGGGSEQRSVPGKIMDDVASITCTHSRFYIIKKDGSLWAWGENGAGELGNGTAPEHFLYPDAVEKPFKVMDNVKEVAGGSNHTLVLKTDNTVWAFGDNRCGQLGDGTTTRRLKPVKVMDNVKTITAGGSHSLAVKKDGSLWAWGDNRMSQAAGTGANVTTPIKILDNVTSVASYGAYTIAVKEDGGVWFWRSGAVTGAGNSYQETGKPELLMKG